MAQRIRPWHETESIRIVWWTRENGTEAHNHYQKTSFIKSQGGETFGAKDIMYESVAIVSVYREQQQKERKP